MPWSRPSPPLAVYRDTRPPAAGRWPRGRHCDPPLYFRKAFPRCGGRFPWGQRLSCSTYGRPRLLSPEYERELTRRAHVASMHGAKGRHYAMVAARALFDLDQPGWVPRDAVFAHFVKRNGDLKWSMLSELGRIDDEETVRAVARIVGRQRLPTTRATALIRRIRIGDCPPHPDRLTKSLLTVIATHCARYPIHLGSGDCHRTRRGQPAGRSSGFLRLAKDVTQL